MDTGNIQLIEPLIIPYRRTMVLLVDDQAMVAEAVRRLLEDLPDIDLHYCCNGSQAVELADRINPTVILQDLVMPDVDGLDLVGEYRANPKTADTPIIVLSSEENPEIKSNAFALGANDYLVKLPDRIELIARIRYHAKAHMIRIQRNQAFTALRESQRQLMAANLELQRLSTVDALTGLKNRRFLDEYVRDEWVRAAREKQFLSALLIDIDYFKQYNDTYGHLAGDEALKKVSEILGAHSRRPADCVARFGGEEFAVILPGTNPAEAHEIGEKYRHSIEKLKIPHPCCGVCDVLTVSIGAATMVPQKGQSFSLLMNAADELMYEAKKAGKNRVISRKEELNLSRC